MNSKWDDQDDAAVHKGLTVSKLSAAGIDDRLVIIEAANTSIQNLALMLNYTSLPDLVSSAMVDGAYTIAFSNGLNIIPAMRYMAQIDDGAGEIGGANLNAKTTGYKDPKSLDSSLYGAKVDLSQGAWKMGLGYTKVADEGDFIAPWRGFPTGGYSRLMAQYNWNANTQTMLLSGDYDFSKAGLIPGFSAKVGYAIQDFDDQKQVSKQIPMC